MKTEHGRRTTEKGTVHEKLELFLSLLDLSPGRKTWEKVATIIGQIARQKSYSHRYVLSVWNRTLMPGHPFADALNKAIRLAEGESLRISSVEERVCRTEGCFAIFTPNVPWRHHCFVCRPSKGNK